MRNEAIKSQVDKASQDVKKNWVNQGWMYAGRGFMLGIDRVFSILWYFTFTNVVENAKTRIHTADHQWIGLLWNPSNGSCFGKK